jgi:hypothetical protein
VSIPRVTSFGHEQIRRSAHWSFADATVHWTAYEVDGCVHAVADVPHEFPKEAIGFSATDTTAAVFLGPFDGSWWTVGLPEPVNPLPESISYDNDIVGAVFSSAGHDQVGVSTDSPCGTA